MCRSVRICLFLANALVAALLMQATLWFKNSTHYSGTTARIEIGAWQLTHLSGMAELNYNSQHLAGDEALAKVRSLLKSFRTAMMVTNSEGSSTRGPWAYKA